MVELLSLSRKPTQWKRRLRVAAGAYAVFLAYNWRAKNQPGDWGPSYLPRIVNAVFILTLRLLGVTSEAVLPPDARVHPAMCVSRSRSLDL